MAKIHGLAYLLIGIIITVFSYYIDKNIKKGFSLFIYIGLLMIIIGIIKLAAQWARNKKEKPSTTPYIHHPSREARHQTRPQHQQTVYCQRCGAALSARANFCYNCGDRVMRRR